MFAAWYPATGLALHLWSITASVLKKNNLLFLFQSIAHSLDKRVGKCSYCLFLAAVLCHVYDFDVRQFNFAVTCGKVHKSIFACCCIVVAVD